MSPRSLILVTLVIAAALIAAGIFWYVRSRGSVPASSVPNNVAELSLPAFSDKVIASKQILLLDVRPATDYTAEHIPDSVSLPSYEIAAEIAQLKLFTGWDTVLIYDAQHADALSNAARDLSYNGFAHLFSLAGGIATYKDAGLSMASDAASVQADLAKVLGSIKVPELTVDELKKRLADKATVAIIDGRTSFEFVTGFIPGAKNIPLHTFGPSMDLGFIPKDKNAVIVIYDRIGNRAKIGVQALIDAGYKNVFNLMGGVEAWTKAKGDLALPKEDGSDLPTLIPGLYKGK